MIFRSKAPLRLGLAGGGTDVPPYCELFGGAILNATLDLYAYASLKPRTDGRVVFRHMDRGTSKDVAAAAKLAPDPDFTLAVGVYNRIAAQYAKEPLACEIATRVDAPPGSGLGTSSTLTVAMVGAFAEWLQLPLGEYDIARLAYEIERKDLGMAGGQQDQYAATFGGFNFMEFYAGEKVIVNPLRVKTDTVCELQHNLVLYNTGTSRLSERIIEAQRKNVVDQKQTAIGAMHHLKEQARRMKEAVLTGHLDEVGELLDFGWEHKKAMAGGITNLVIDEIYQTVKRAGASGGKISGAGGGGFMIAYCPGNTRYAVAEALAKTGVAVTRFEFTSAGLTTWRTQ